jgi:integrase
MKKSIPSYRLHKPSGQAVVRLDGRDHYLGKHDTDASREKYRRVVAEWLSNGSHPPARSTVAVVASVIPTINELILAYWRHAETYYRRPDGTPTGEPTKIKLAVKPLKSLYGMTLAEDFGPKSLKALRDKMVDGGLCRLTANQRIGIVIRVFRHGVENEMIPPAVYQSLKAVEGLRAGRSAARESKVVTPVPDGHVEAIKPHVTRQVWALIELQRLTGMRSGEAVIMRSGDIDRSGEVWAYTPSRHKTEHHGRKRTIYLGPKARAIAGPWLRDDPTAYLFQPKDAVAESRAKRRRQRVSPMTPSQLARRQRPRPARAAGDRYTPAALGHAIRKACVTAGHACKTHSPACRNQPRMSSGVTSRKPSPMAS